MLYRRRTRRPTLKQHWVNVSVNTLTSDKYYLYGNNKYTGIGTHTGMFINTSNTHDIRPLNYSWF